MNIAMSRFVQEVGGDKPAAEALGLSPLTIKSLRRGIRRVQPNQALRIEQLTQGRIDRVSLVWPNDPPPSP